MRAKLFRLLLVLSLVSLACQLSGQPSLPTATPESPAVPTSPVTPTEVATQAPVPTSTPQPAVAVDIQVESPASLDQLHTTTPLALRFGQPMDPNSANPAALTYPWVEGQITWDDSHTLLTFTPLAGFEAGYSYRLFVNPALLTAGGAPLQTYPQWALQTLAAPRVTGRTPGVERLDSRQPEIHITFDQPMDASSVAAALQIKSATLGQAVPAYRLEWPQPSEAVMRFDQALAPGERYHFLLEGSATDQQGMALGQDYAWDQWVDSLFTVVGQPSLEARNAPITLQFHYTVDPQSIQDALKISPAVEGLQFQWDEANNQLRLISPQPLASGKPYTLQIGSGVRETSGAELPPAPSVVVFGPPPVLDYHPQAGEDIFPDADVQITFDRPMDHASTEAAFSLKNADTRQSVAGTFRWQENTLIFESQSDLEAYTNYAVSLEPTAADTSGSLILEQPFAWDFSPRSYPYSASSASFGSYGPNAQVLDAEGRRAVQFLAQDLSQVTFELYRLNLEQFLDRYSSGFRGVAGSQYKPVRYDDAPLQTTWQQDVSRGGMGYSEAIFETFIPAETPPGFYILNLDAGEGVTSQLILVLTRNTLAVKQAEGEIVAWVSDIADATHPNGASIPGVEVSVYARDGVLITQGKANEQGIFRTQVNRDPQPLIVVARQGEDYTVSGLSNEWRNEGGFWGWWWQEAPRSLKYSTYLYTDRPIYRPGQTVYFKAILRNDDDAALSVPPEGTPVTLHIRDPRGNVAQSYTLATDAFGSVFADFQVAEGASLGDYQVEVAFTLPGLGTETQETHTQVFKVQDYRKPDYKVSVAANGSKFTQGDSVSVLVNTAYYFGQPVANAQITLKKFYLSEYYDYWQPSSQKQYTWYDSGEEPVVAQTDAQGNFSFTFNAEMGYEYYSDYGDWGSSLRRATWGVEATVDDGSHQTVSSFTIINVYNAAEKVSLDVGGYLKTPGQAFNISARVTNLFDQPVGERTLTLELRRWSRSSYDYDTIVQTSQFTTGSDGKLQAAFNIEQPGYYQLRASSLDANGNAIYTSRWVYAYRGDLSWYSDGNGLRISADKESYAPNETASLLVESDFSGPALVTLERGHVHREYVAQLTAPVTKLEVPIQASDAPNIFVSVSAWEPQDTTLTNDTYSTKADSRLKSASVELKVPVTGKTLNVTITPDKSTYGPRDEATFTVRVTDQNGSPVQAQVSLGVVDEAIYALSPELSGPMFEAFYYQRDNIVRGYNSMAPTRALWAGGRGGGGGDTTGNPRSEFADTAAWYPALVTDASGQVAVTLTLPDNLTSWRISARAVTLATQVGETYINIVTQKPIIVRPILPRGLTAGDQMSLLALVHNYSGNNFELKVSLSASGTAGATAPFQMTGAPEQVITLNPGEVRLLAWPIVASQAGEAQILVQAITTDNSAQDAVQLPLTIRPLAIPEVSSQVGAFEGEFVTSLYLPEGALDLSSVQVALSHSIAGDLLAGLEYLTGYPYGCVEQTMSRALPNAVVGRAFRTLGVGNPTLEADLPSRISASLQRLYGYQHGDGGWGWWYDDATHDYQTAWVIFGLALTAEAGYEVDPGVIERGTTWLNQNLGNMDVRTRAYALYSLALAGKGNLEATRRMLDQLQELDPFSQAGLALALHKLGDTASARQVLDVLAESATNRNGMVYWAQPGEDGHYYDKTMASTTRSTALVLDAFIKIQPEHAFIPGIVQWLMSQRRPDGWGSTNETSFTILALTDYLVAMQGEAAEAGYTVELNGQPISSGTLGRNDPALSLEIRPGQMATGLNLLRITSPQGGTLYYKVTQRIYVAQSQIAAAGVVTVTRRYFDPTTGQEISSVTAGQLVQIQLTLALPQTGYFVVLEDKLPGGLEALNEGLNTTSHDASTYDEGESFRWQEYGYNNKEIRGDRVSFFFTEVEATTVTYMARATQSGTFTSLPAEAYAMYDSTLWGRSDSVPFIVTR